MEIFFVKPQTISLEDKKKIEEQGFLVIEHPNPDEVKIIAPEMFHPIEPHSLLLSAFEGLVSDSNAMTKFSKQLYRRLLAEEKQRATKH